MRRQVGQQRFFLGIGQDGVEIEHDLAEQVGLAEAAQHARRLDQVAAVEAVAVGLGRHRVVAERDRLDAGLFRRHLAVEGVDILPAPGVKTLGKLGVRRAGGRGRRGRSRRCAGDGRAGRRGGRKQRRGMIARLIGPAQPVVGAALGNRRGAGLGHALEVGDGQVGLVQLDQGDPAGEELGLGLVLAAVETAAAHGAIGRLIVAGLQRRVEIAQADGVHLRCRAGAQPGRREVGQDGEAQGLQVLFQQVARAFEGQGRIVRVAGQGRLIKPVGRGRAGAHGQHGIGDGPPMVVDIVFHVADGARRAVLRIEQQAGQARDMVVLAEIAAEGGVEIALRDDVERLAAPPLFGQGLGVGGTAELAIGGDQLRRALDRQGRRAGEPVDDLLRRQARGRHHLLGGDLALGLVRPAPQLAPRGVQAGETIDVAVAGNDRPGDDLAGDRARQRGGFRIGLVETVAFNVGQGGIQRRGVGVGQRAAGRIGLGSRRHAGLPGARGRLARNGWRHLPRGGQILGRDIRRT